jgi:hypothetical protein
VPMLDYKKLLKIHYTSVSADRINVYNMLRELFSGYEVENGLVLADIKEPSKYFAALTQIVNKVLLDGANKILALFDHDITIENFTFKTEFTTDNRLEPVINIEVNYRDQQIDNYHTFLNEARLTALAVSLYFAAIKAMLGTLKDDCLKMLVLDDLLISLDMSNRLKLLDVLQAEFSDFQTFFFTHDKELFEIYKKLLLWEKFEFYVDDIAPVPAAKVVKSASELERAKKYYAEKEYDSCALQLRKGCENLLKSYLAPEERLNRNGEELDFSGMLDRAKSKNNDLKTLLERLDSDRSYILNRLCHDDHGQIYSGELRNAISALETLEGLLK